MSRSLVERTRESLSRTAAPPTPVAIATKPTIRARHAIASGDGIETVERLPVALQLRPRRRAHVAIRVLPGTDLLNPGIVTVILDTLRAGAVCLDPFRVILFDPRDDQAVLEQFVVFGCMQSQFAGQDWFAAEGTVQFAFLYRLFPSTEQIAEMFVPNAHANEMPHNVVAVQTNMRVLRTSSCARETGGGDCHLSTT